ncbi:MAG: phosphate acyltransferase PlsX [Coriobacteriaceae bacterium]|nr:phosphate acyltransferase PlsX [Coriobacteriaceae bacterium]
MQKNVVVAVDAMGGDNAPDAILAGVVDALAAYPNLEVKLCGLADVVEPFAAEHERCEAVACTQVIEMDEHPAQAFKAKPDSSIVVGCKLVKDGEADAFYSAGSTGACFTAGTMVIRRLKGVSRPALCTNVPCPSKTVVMCDVGANADCKPEYLVQFAQMASMYAELLMNVANPQVRLLNIGEEETKGSTFAQEAHALLKAEVPNFAGNCEGRDILAGTCDVVVTDGFTGNVALKTIEGVGSMLFGEIKRLFMASTKTKMAAAVLKPGFKELKDSVDPDTFGAAPILGLRGPVFIGHGSSSPLAVKNSLGLAVRSVEADLTGKISSALAEQAATSKGEA